jgi:hypothetical protein
MESPKDEPVTRLTDETIVTRRLAVGIALAVGAAAVVGGVGDAAAQSKEGIIILDKQGINPDDPSKPAVRKGNRVSINPSDPDKPARTGKRVAVDPTDPDANPPDDRPAWARELFSPAGGGGGGGGGGR